MTQEVLKLALECAERCEAIDGMYSWSATITAIKEALKEHAMRETQRLGQEIEQCQCTECQIKPHASDCAVHSEPAYPKGKCDCGAQPEQEPVATDWNAVHEKLALVWYRELSADEGLDEIQDLINTTPPQRTEQPAQRKPLTKEQIEPIAIDVLGYGALLKQDMELFTEAVRAVEAAHDIKENT